MKPDRKARYLRRALLISLLLAGMFTLTWVAGAQDGSPLGKRTTGQVLDSLTAEERQWLSDHPVITLVHDPAWPPIEFSDERGEISGIAGDYVRLVEQRLGVKFTRVRNLSWQEGYARQKRWEIDMATCVAKTPQRTEFWAFSKPYLTIPIVIATQSDVTYIYDIKELFGRNVALVKGYAIDDWITNDFPEIKLTRVKDPQEGLALLQRGEVFAYIDNLLIIGDYQAKMRVTNIKIAGQTPYVNAQCMAVRKDWAPLAGILDKALDSIPDTERKEIYGRWLPLRYEHGFDYTLLYRAVAIFALILLVLTFWNRMLAKEIRSRKRLEAALRESEAKYRSIFENAVEGMFQSALDGRILSASPSLAVMLGYDSPEDLIQSIKDIGKDVYVHPEDRTRFIQQVRQSDLVTGFEQQVRRRDGSIFWVSLSARSVRDERGELIGIDGFVIDVDEHKRTEEALRKSEERYRAFVANSTEGIWRCEPDQPISTSLPVEEQIQQAFERAFIAECNEATARMYGVDRAEELVGTRWLEMVTDDPRNVEVIRAFIESGYRLVDVETVERDREGRVRHFLNSMIGVVEDGHLVGAWGVQRDITGQKQAEGALRDSEEKYRALIETTDTGYVVIDSEGRVLDANPEYVKLTGHMTLPEILGRSVTDWTAEHDLTRNADEIRRCWSQGFVRNLEIDYVDQHGHLTPIEINATLLGIPDKPRIVALCRDITERKQADEESQQANLVVENSPVVVFRWRADEGWPVEMVSRNISQFGYTPEDLLSGAVPFASMVHPEDVERVAREVQEYTATGVDRFQQEYRIFAKDGEVRWVDDRTLVERDGGGQVTHYQGIVIDITERKVAEEALRQEKHFSDTIIDSMPGMFYLFDEQGRVARWNKQLEHFTGYDAEAISRMNAIEFIHPEDQDAVAEAIHEVFVHGESHVEGRVVTKHGGAIPFYLTGLRITFGDKTYLLGVGLDIRERVRVEAESARLQVLLRSVILQSPVPMVLVLPDGTVELFNEGCRSVLGVPEGLQLPPDLNLFTLEKTWIDYSAEGVQVPLAERPLTLALQGKTTRSREMKVVRQDGAERWILVDAVPVVDDRGTVIAGFLVFVDITERKQAEEYLAESMKRLQTVVTGAPVVLYSFDRHGVFTLSEGKGLAGLGIKPGEIVGRTIFEVYGDQPASINALRRAMAGETFTIELTFPAGGTFEVSHTAMLDEAGDYNGTIGVLVDITERKRAEKALQLSEATYREIFNTINDTIWIHDIETFMFLDVNNKVTEMFGYSVREALDLSVEDISSGVPPFIKKTAAELLSKAAAGEPQLFEWHSRHKDGHLFWTEVSLKQGTIAGRECLLAIERDITERKRAEDELRTSLEEKESLLKEVHHRVKNNLQVISSLLKLQARKVQSPEVLGFLQDTQNRIRSMTLLHETLYRSGNLAKVAFPQYVRDICAHLARAYASDAGNILLRHEVADVTLDLDQAIPAGLIISELLSNAFKHAFPSRPDGEILVELQETDEHHLVLRVSDNGVGLPADTDPESTETLGLLLVRSLTGQLDGRMSVSSGQGTVIEIVFPAQSI